MSWRWGHFCSIKHIARYWLSSFFETITDSVFSGSLFIGQTEECDLKTLSCPFVIQLNRKITNNYKHCFNSQVKLVRANLKSEEFKATYNQTCDVFAKYQMGVHKDRPDECDEMQVRLLYISATKVRLKSLLCIHVLEAYVNTHFCQYMYMNVIMKTQSLIPFMPSLKQKPLVKCNYRT